MAYEYPHNYASYDLLLMSEFVDVAETLSSGWVFRGQADSDWDISSSLEREAERLTGLDQSAYEGAILKYIKLAVSFDETSRLENEDHFSWLALLQHHGCKTRLVDFTESFYVALYFAVRGCPDCDAAVWAIGTAAMDARVSEIREQYDFSLSAEETPRRLVNNSIELPDRYRGDDRLAIMYGTPARLNHRLIAQQGLFLSPLNLSKSFMENLTAGLGLTGTKEPVPHLTALEDLRHAAKSEKVIKIGIPQSQHRPLLFHLKKMNITEATLFPGLDGYARSLNYLALGME
jgi:hypothetical protein